MKFINLIKLESLIFQKIPTIPQKKSIHKFLLKSKTFSGSFQQITCIKFQLNCILQYKKDKHFNCFPHCMFYKIYSKYHKYCLNWLYILQDMRKCINLFLIILIFLSQNSNWTSRAFSNSFNTKAWRITIHKIARNLNQKFNFLNN